MEAQRNHQNQNDITTSGAKSAGDVRSVADELSGGSLKAPANNDRSVSIEDLEACLVTAARVIEAHGEAYIPIFIRLKEEIAERKSETNVLEEALRLARTS